MTTPYKCPCCDGWGKRQVPVYGYNEYEERVCLACNGTGLVWEPGPPTFSVTCGTTGTKPCGAERTGNDRARRKRKRPRRETEEADDA